MKKNLSQTITTKLYPVKKAKKNKEKCFKNKRLCDNIYSIAYL